MVKTEIKSSNPLISFDFKDWWRYKDLLYTFAWRDIKVRYGQTALGLIWVIFQPLVSLIVLYVVFGKIAGFADNNPEYPIFLLSAVVLWQYFNNVFNESSQALLNAQDIISKIYFPKIFLTFSKGLTFLIDLTISLIILIVVLLIYKGVDFFGLIQGLFYLFLFCIFSVSMGSIASSLIIRFRDLRFIYPFMHQFYIFYRALLF